jgi:hypothetical protein
MKRSFDLDDLLHPSRAFCHPSEVANDPDLTLNEKRAILASWASDACALEAAPELRETPSGTQVRFDEIMEALRGLDRQANDGAASVPRRLLRKRRLGGLLRSAKPDRGSSLQ